MSACGGRGNGQDMLSSCSSESSTFFIILGFTMLVLVLLLFVIVVIACVRRQRIRARAQMLQNSHLAGQGMEDDCVIFVNGSGQFGSSQNGRNMENVKCVIMAGEEKPTFIAHLVPRIFPVEEELREMETPNQEAGPKEGDGDGDGEREREREGDAGEREREREGNADGERHSPAITEHEVT